MKLSKLRRLTAVILVLAMLVLPAEALTVEQARVLLRSYYVDPIPQEVLEAGTVSEMLDALGDPYTEYLTAEEYASFWNAMSDESLVGIGVVSSMTPDGPLVEEVVDGSPAQEGGLAAGDILLQVNGNPTAGVEFDTVIGWIRGAEGTPVTITYRRGEEEHTVTLTRATVVLPATTGELLEGNVGYIQCTTFGDETVAHFRDIIEELGGDATCWLIDLRGNTGGVSDAAVDTAGLFCGPGHMLTFRYGNGSYSHYGCEEAAITDLPVVVLVDGYTASASEAFCAALRDYGAAHIVGSRTYGKGVAQGLWDQTTHPRYFPDGDAIKITIARFFSPLGNTNDTLGILPDLLVDDEYAADVGYLLAMNFDDEAVEHILSFPWGPGGYQISLDDAQDEDWKPVYAALLDALPDIPLYMDGQEVQRAFLAQLYGLELTRSPFPDVDDAAYHSYALNTLKTYGLVQGDEAGLFHPAATLTRAELCQMLYNVLNAQPPTNAAPFPDVAEDAWYADAVTAMANRGLVAGYDDGLFHPEDTLDHQQLFVILGRLAAWLNCDLADRLAAATPQDLADESLQGFADWAKPSVWLLYTPQPQTYLLDPADIDPAASTAATREKAAYVLYALLSYLTILP